MRIRHGLTAVATLLLPLAVRAQEVAVTIPQPLGDVSVARLAGNIIKNGLGLVGSIALIMFIYGGFLYLTAGGNEEQVGKGKKTIIYATIGLLIVFFAYSIVNFVITGLTSPTAQGTQQGGAAPSGQSTGNPLSN